MIKHKVTFLSSVIMYLLCACSNNLDKREHLTLSSVTTTNSAEEAYNLSKDVSSPESVQLFPEDFFWDNTDESTPFGSDEGDTALGDFRTWRKQNPTTNLSICLDWVIQEVGEMSPETYLTQIVDRSQIEKQVKDDSFDDQQYIYTLDVSIIATVLGQFVDEGKIDKEAQKYIHIALSRQIVWSELQGWDAYTDHLKIIKERLNKVS